MPHSLYLHIPFCSHRCAYCDFNTYAGQRASVPAYVEALALELEWVGRNAPADLTLHTIFFGGGTPTLLSPAQFERILRAVRASFVLTEDCEITTEANPGTVSPEDLEALRSLGINRISFGVQSANGEELRMLERQHTYLDVRLAVSAARRARFDSLNLDLIYGLPEQSLQTWQSTVARVLDLQPEHISAYALTLEHGTPFGRWSARGLLSTPNPDIAADMYEWISGELEAGGYVHYEISNWARDGHACRHNLQYWRGLPYLGLGAGAHGYAGGYRYSNTLRIKSFIGQLRENRNAEVGNRHDSQITNSDSRSSRPNFPFSPAVIDHHIQTVEDEISEFMITGLRLTREGIAASDFQTRFGRDLRTQFPRELAELTQLGLLEWAEMPASSPPAPTSTKYEGASEIIRLTPRGRLLGNQVFIRFVDPSQGDESRRLVPSET
jgi:oxygen-independent coproporphyrinogen-3 oxidase